MLRGIIEAFAMGVELINGTLSLPKEQGQGQETEQEDAPIEEGAPLRRWDEENLPLADYPE